MLLHCLFLNFKIAIKRVIAAVTLQSDRMFHNIRNLRSVDCQILLGFLTSIDGLLSSQSVRSLVGMLQSKKVIGKMAHSKQNRKGFFLSLFLSLLSHHSLSLFGQLSLAT